MPIKKKAVGALCDDCKKDIGLDDECVVIEYVTADDDEYDHVYCSWRCAVEANLRFKHRTKLQAYLDEINKPPEPTFSEAFRVLANQK
jgi:hypothetical protein